MTDHNTITPPPELVQQWDKKARLPDGLPTEAKWQRKFATRAAQWGADQELEACCKVLDDLNDGFWSEKLRAARRPKPPSLKQQAFNALRQIESEYPAGVFGDMIRRALEQLDD